MRLEREKQTVELMILMYCRSHHKGTALCDECEALRDYAIFRIGRCKFGSSKPVCAKCTVHCYRHDMRLRIRDVMRYSGPRMLVKHPLRAIEHLWHSITSPRA